MVAGRSRRNLWGSVNKAESHSFAVPRIETLWNLVRSIENVS